MCGNDVEKAWRRGFIKGQMKYHETIVAYRETTIVKSSAERHIHMGIRKAANIISNRLGASHLIKAFVEYVRETCSNIMAAGAGGLKPSQRKRVRAASAIHRSLSNR